MSGAAAVLASIHPSESMPTMTSICTHCGQDITSADAAQRRIQDLEAQVRLLNIKAAAAVDKLADYEDEVRSLRESYTQLQQQQQQQQQQPRPLTSRQTSLAQSQLSAPTPPPDQPAQLQTAATTPPITTPIPTPSSPARNTSRLASLSSFLPGRKRDTASLPQPPSTPSAGFFSQQSYLTSSPSPIRNQNTSVLADPQQPSEVNPNNPTQSQPPLTLLSLQTSLETERNLRLQAESNLTQTQVELEELTATLFGQANEMVATERKARAKLEERVKVLEDRDGEKRRRLERLEKALERIDRVRGLVKEEQSRGFIAKEIAEIRVVEVNCPEPVHEQKEDVHRGGRGNELRVVNDTGVV